MAQASKCTIGHSPTDEKPAAHSGLSVAAWRSSYLSSKQRNTLLHAEAYSPHRRGWRIRLGLLSPDQVSADAHRVAAIVFAAWGHVDDLSIFRIYSLEQ